MPKRKAKSHLHTTVDMPLLDLIFSKVRRLSVVIPEDPNYKPYAFTPHLYGQAYKHALIHVKKVKVTAYSLNKQKYLNGFTHIPLCGCVFNVVDDRDDELVDYLKIYLGSMQTLLDNKGLPIKRFIGKQVGSFVPSRTRTIEIVCLHVPAHGYVVMFDHTHYQDKLDYYRSILIAQEYENRR